MAKPKAAAKKPAAKKPAPPAKKAAPTKKAAAPAKKASGGKKTTEIEKIQVVETVAEAPAHPMDPGIPAEAEREIEEEQVAEEHQLPALTEEEQELQKIYGDVTAPARAHTEFSDQKTADEDRPMVPEINARDERKHHWQDRRDQRRQRRDQRDRDRQARREGGGGGGGGGNGQPQQHNQNHHNNNNGQQQQRPPQQQHQNNNQHAQQRLPLPAPTPVNTHEHDALARVGTPLGDAASSVFTQLRNGQPLPVKQLAAMMRKRNLTEVEPEALWPQLKAELLGDERSYRTLGLRPRIVYRGRDLFAPGPVAMSSTADAEAGFAAALSRLAGATHRALAQRIAKASPAGFERLIHAFLVAAGYREISWVKRVDGISYASALAPGIDRTVLISARSGDTAIDRRGIGELRVGVEAKDLVAGILFSARQLSDEAEAELQRAGRSIAVVCGDQLVASLIERGVGVVSAAAPVHYVDDQLLDEVLAG